MKDNNKRVAEVGYSKGSRSLEIALPAGTRLTDLSKVIDYLARDVFSKLPRGCTACTSGDHLVIRERLDDIIRVDLDQKVIVG
jgi:hypothetical protein